MRMQLVLLLAVVICALAVVTSQHEARRAFTALQQAQQQQRKLEVEWGQLQLEQSTWARHARVEKIATEQLSMQLPNANQMHVIVAAKPPVASR